jgi:uncharacterized protein
VIVPEDCTSCGACCHSDQSDYIAVFGVDEARMDARALALTEQRDGRRFMRFAGGRCIALEEAQGRWLCAIYGMRPDACRWLERGSGTCQQMIAAHQLVRR